MTVDNPAEDAGQIGKRPDVIEFGVSPMAENGEVTWYR
jgi:hypothetical protein